MTGSEPVNARIKKKYEDALAALEMGGLLTPSEVASLFRVDPKTVTRWTVAGRLPCVKTPGGHVRFRASVIRGMLDDDDQ